MTNPEISDENYEHVLNVCKACKINSMKDHVLYWLVYYSFFIIPGYIWDTMSRFTNVNLKLILDIEKYQYIGRAIRAGISMIFKGYTEVNNNFLKSYDANKSSSYIIYLDAYNIYGHSMMQLFPTEILD